MPLPHFYTIIHILVHSQMHSVPQSLSLMHPLTLTSSQHTNIRTLLHSETILMCVPPHTLSHTQSLISTHTAQVHAPSLVLS